MMTPHVRCSLRRAAHAALAAAAILILSSSAFAAAGSGTAAITPSIGVPAGSAGTWTIRYTAVDTFTTGTIQIVIPAGWTAPQASDPSSAGYVTASTTGTLGAPAVTIAGNIVTVHIAALDTSQTVDVVYGDPSINVLGRALAQAAVQSGVEFAVSSDPVGASPAAIATSPVLDVVAGPIAQLVFLTPPRTFTADGESAVIRVETEDQFGNPAAVPGIQNVNLSSSAGSGRFSHLGGTNFVQTGTVTIASGEDTVSLYYRDAVAGGKTITASPGGQSWTNAQQAVTIQAGAPLRLKTFPADTTITAGDFVRYRLRVEDAEGNPSPPSNNQTITLAGAPGSFYTTSNHGAAITQIGIASGTSTVYLDYQNTNKAMTSPDVLGFLDQDGILPTLDAASANVLVDNAPFDPAASDISAGKPSAIANAVDSIEVTVHAKDIYGNGVDGATVVLASSGSGNFVRQPAGTTGNAGTAVGSIRSTKAEGKTLTAKVDGVDITASTGVTFTAGPFSPGVSTVVISPSTVVANGIDTTVVTVTVKDAQGNPISGSSVTLESTGGPNTIRQPVGLTGVDGIAVGSVKSAKAETKTITAKVGGVAITATRNASFVAGPFSPGVSTVVISPSTVVANGIDTTVVTVTVKDAQGNPISGSSVTLESTGGPNTIRQPVGLTGVDGIAVGSVKSAKAEPKTISAKVGGVGIAITRNVTFVAGPFSPVSSEVHVDKTTAMADGVDAITVTVYAFDAQGNGIAGKTVTIAATGGGNVYNQPVGTTDQNGRAIGSLKSTVAEGKTISAKADGADIAETVPVTFGAGALHHFNVTHGGTATAGDASSVTIDARDIQENKITGFAGLVKAYTSSTIPGDYITWGLGNAAGSILSESGDTVRYQFVPADLGDAELRITDTKVESITIYASSGAVTSSSATPLVVSHAAPDRMILVSGNNQRAVVNQEVASALVVRVEDAFANPIPGVTVTWAITKGGGYFDASRSIPGIQTTSATASDGTAAGELWRLGTVSGLNSDGITASMPTGSTRSVAFTATTDFAPINSIVLTPVSKSVTVNSATTVTATLRDTFNNLVANEYVTIFVKDAPDGHLSRAAGSSTDSLSALMRRGKSDSTGTVRVTYNAPAAAGLQDVIDAYSNTIPAGNVADVTYTSIASGATDLRATVLTGQPSRAGVAFSFMVEAVDGNGNRDLTNTSRIVLDPQAGAGFTFSLTNFGATITEANLASGTVTLYGRGTTPGSWRTNVNDKASVLLAGHFDVTVVPDTVSSYHVVAPSNATVGSDFSVAAEARDRFGNTATSAGYQINFRAVQAADSTRAASGTLSVPSGNLVSGVFNGSNFRYNVAEQMRVEVTSAANAVKGYSGIVTVGHAAAYRLVKLAGDSTGVSVGDSLRLRAQVIDIYGNAVNNQNVFFTVQQGGGYFAAPQAVTDANGRVSVWFRTGTVRGTNVARASILEGTPPELETQSFTVTTVPKTTIAHVTLAIPGGMSYHAGEVFAGNVAAYDQYNNLIDTDSSSRLRCVARHSTMSFVPAVMTLGAGVASFTASDTLSGVNRIRVLSFAGDSLSDWSGPITIQPASTYRIVKVRGDTLGVHVGAKVGLKTRVSDRYGNVVPAEIVRFVITSNLGGSPSLWDGTGAPNDGIVLSDAMGAAVCSLTTDSHAGVNAVSASILDANPPALERVTFSVGTSAGTIARFDVLPDGFSKKAAQNFSLQLIAYDLNNNVATADDTSRVFLGSNGSAVFSINPVTLSHGQATVTVHDNRAESLILSAQTLGGGALSRSGAITISPEVPAGAITFASIVPDSITANGTSLSTITSQPVKDAYGNVVAPLTLIRVTPSLGTVASDDQDPSTPLTYERQTAASGAVSVVIRSATSSGPSTVAFQSVTGSASGNATVHFMPAPACTYAGYLTPRYLVPGDTVSFRCSVTNASPTRLNLTTQSCTISFADGSAHTYEARLAAPAFLKGSSTDTLDFEAEPVPEDILGGSYTPRVKLIGTDRYGSPYQVEFNAGSNSVSVSVIEIVSVTSSKSIVSRGDTFEVDVRVKNGGGSTVSMSDIVPRSRHTHGYYALVGAWNPALPNSLPASTEREYRASMRVFTNSPLGADTIDASATANINGSQVQDTSAYPNVAPIFIQSAATIAYVAGTLSPSVVSRGQSHSFSLSLRNTGDAVVILDGAKTKLTFTDGIHPVQVALGSAGALPGNQVTGITFPAVAIPLAMSAGSWPVKLYLGGTENGGSYADTLNLSDSVEVVAPAHLVYHSGTLAPTTVSKRSAVAFSVGVDNTGGASVECIPDSTWITFKNGSIVYLARLDGTFGRSVKPGLNTLYFSSVTVPDAMPAGIYSATVRVMGTENSVPFSTSFVLSNQISVQDPSQISIDRIVVPQSVTRSQSASWPVRMILKNNGEASVVINFNAAKTFISFNIVGLGDRTYEYTISHPTHLEGSGSDTLAGGALDSLLFVVTTTGSTTGLALVNGRVEGIDINSGLTVFDDTYNGGFSHMAIQMPGAPRVARELPSRTTVTSGQTTAWQDTVEVCNSGEAALTLKMDSTYVFYDGRLPLLWHLSPAGFVEGGLVLEGGSCKHLLFDISPTPLIPAGADIALHAHVGFTENNNGEYRYYDTKQSGSGFGALRVQAPAKLRIVQVTNKAPRAPYVNAGQEFTVLLEVRNEGEARADSIRIALEKSGSSTIADTLVLVGALNGASSVADTFRVTAGASSGLETFRARIRGALDDNSRQTNLVSVLSAIDSTASAQIQGLAALAVTSVTPSQPEVNANQSVDWTVRVSIKNNGEAPLALGTVAAADISFSRGGVKLTDYSVIAPDTLASGAHVLTLAGGGSDALIYRVVSTGSDTGMVAIGALVSWHDMNDPERAPETAGGSSSVHVKPPSGLRIISVTSDAPNNALFPNTSIVDVGQVFNVTVRVENTGGDDLDSVKVRLASNGASHAAIVGDSLAAIPSNSVKDFVFSVTAASTPGTEILSSSITHAVSKNTGQRVIPAQAVESVENLRVELPALLSCGASITAPAGAVDDTLSTGQSFVVTALVTNEGQAAIDTLGEVTLVLPSSMHFAVAEPLVKRFTAGRAMSWTVVAPAVPSQDTLRVLISRIPSDVNRAAPAAVHIGEARLALRTELAARLSACAVTIDAPPGAVDGTLSTEQDFLVHSVFTPSANADSVWVELTVPGSFSVTGDRTRYIGRGTGAPRTIDWAVKAPSTHVASDTLVTRAGGRDVNTLLALQTCRAVFPVHVLVKPSLALSAGISGPHEALDGVVSTDMPFTVTASAAKTGEASIDTTGARIELVLPAGQGYALDGAAEHYRKAFSPGQPVVWNIRAPGSPTSPSNIEVKFVEPYATDVNTNAACTITAGDIFLPVQTEAGSVLMSNISRQDSIPPYVVPQGARGVPIMRIVLRNNSGYTIGLDTLFVAFKDGRGKRIANPARSIAQVALGATFAATVTSDNPVAIVVAHGVEALSGTPDTLLLRADIAAAAPAGEIRLEIEHSRDVVMTITITGGGAGSRVGVSLDGTGGDIAGHFLSGPLSIMSGRFDEYVHNYPNPFRAGAEPTKICYFLKQDANVGVKIYDLGGNLVRSMRMGAGSAGGTGAPEGTWHEVPWDGRNDRGELVRNGVYLCKVEAGSQSALIKIAVAK